MAFDPAAYGDAVARILAYAPADRTMPLVCVRPRGALVEGAKALTESQNLFTDSAHPQGALAGLWLYLSDFERAHAVAQEDSSAEGSYWHAILHRQEPDDWNSGYWFRRVGSRHPVFVPLAEAAADIAARNPGSGLSLPRSGSWDPHAFIDYCASARSAGEGSLRETVALEVQRAEWELLFHHCAAAII